MDTATKPVLSEQLQSLINGSELYSRREILSTTSLPPSVPGVYAWFFKETPADVPINGCVTKSSTTLLYVVISPDKISKQNSRQNLRRRITTHDGWGILSLSTTWRRLCTLNASIASAGETSVRWLFMDFGSTRLKRPSCFCKLFLILIRPLARSMSD